MKWQTPKYNLKARQSVLPDGNWAEPDDSWKYGAFNLPESDLSEDSLGESRIENTPGVCGGVACIRGTRIPVWVLEQAKRLGFADDEILVDYPTLNNDDLLAAWDYVDSHHKEIDDQITSNED